MLPSLKYCPFCGEKDMFYINDISQSHYVFGDVIGELNIVFDEYQFTVECGNCSTKIYGPICMTKEEAYHGAIETWNTRY